MQIPKRVKHRKTFKPKMRGVATRGNHVAFGDYGLQALEPGRVTARQIEAGRVASQRQIPNTGKLIIRIFPHFPITARPAETRMGQGKGDVDHWVAAVKPGAILYELRGVTEEQARLAFNRTAHKMPVRCRFVKRQNF